MDNGKDERLRLSTKLGFGAGDIFGGGSLVIIGFFYLYFITDVLLISPALAGIVFLISKIWDASIDPIIGVLTDRTRTRFGRRRPYFLAGVVLVSLAFSMLWYNVGFEKEWHRLAYALGSYMFFTTVHSFMMIPYFSLASELTLDYTERTSLATIRMLFSMGSSLVCAVVPFQIVKMFPDESTGFFVMAVIFGLVFGLPYLATFFLTRERREFQREPEPFSIRKTYIEPFKTPTFVNVLLMYLFTMSTMDIIMSIMMYFMTYYMGRAGETNYVLGVLLFCQIIALLIFSATSRKTGKKKAFLAAGLFFALVMAGSILITRDQPRWVIYVFSAFVGLGSGGMGIMIYSILPDVPDVDELYTGERREGIYSGVLSFLRQLSTALGIFIVSNVLAYAGFIKPIEQTIDGVKTLVKQPQSPELLLTLRLMLMLVPVVYLTVCVYNAWRYGLTRELHDRLKVFLIARRAGAVNVAEEEALKNVFERGKTGSGRRR
ncbi:MAG TPA: glycoside-pentoside-hexuronide (GPH):cation symporter [Spirochaetota bacterium]|nr:glycoside-pentoside-hexuronide (GPH):cation symporter [Spirochaetota bacterium]